MASLGLCPYPPDQPLQRSFRPLEDGLYAGSSAINDRGRVPILVLNSESESAGRDLCSGPASKCYGAGAGRQPPSYGRDRRIPRVLDRGPLPAHAFERLDPVRVLVREPRINNYR